MPGLRLYTSNRLENLAEKLAELLTTALASPFDKEIIVVQSKGMERWVSMQLAQHHGVCANCRFPFPNTFVQELFQKVFPDLPERSPFEPQIMTWKIMKLLPSCIEKPVFESLKTYLKNTKGDLKRFQLSERIADIFDQYVVFRPQMVFRWEQGHENHWQAVLWRKLLKGHEKWHRAGLAKRFLKVLNESSPGISGLPERVSVFGISALPRFHMQVFSDVARFSQVNLFLMNPCREYWGDILSDWEIRKKKIVSQSAEDLPPEKLHLEKGNSLIGSMGTLGRDFFDLVNEFHYEEFPCFEDCIENNLLSHIQSDILNLRDALHRGDEKRILDANDTSIQIHSCHSPMREIEVLHDQLLHMFEKEPGLRPQDILVMTPDIETYSPYIQAVFDMPADDSRNIPFSIADRSIRKESRIIDTFLSILDLTGSRFTASQVLAILESQAVRRRFGLLEKDLDLVKKWIREARIRWGIDGQSRTQLGLPDFPENTWKAGLERLLLGYAFPGQDEHMFGGVLPYDHMEGDETSVLGKFLEFADLLFARVASLGQPRTLDQWSGCLVGVLEDFFIPDEATEGEMQVIRHTINDLSGMEALADFHEVIDSDLIKYHLRHFFEREGWGFGFITGGVTFCAMLPMRSIPFKVICLVGMNNNAYPRQSRPLGFDLMAKHPQPGDRSRRNDDRYLFLETVLSARRNLYISHVGQSIQDNSLIPPAILVSELMDYIEEGFAIPGIKILDHIVTRHRLQAFSPEYFKNNEKLLSYSWENLQAAQCILKDRRAPVPFISTGLPEPPEVEWRKVDIDDLCRFFSNPAQFLLNRRLGVYLGERNQALEEREAFDIKGLERYLLEEKLVKMRLAGRDLKAFLPLTQASGQLPHGTVGKCLYENLSQEVEYFAQRIESCTRGIIPVPVEVDLYISTFRLTGRIHVIYPERLMYYRPTKVKPKDRLRIWIHHLALNALMADNYPRTSMLAGLDPNDSQGPVWVAWEYSPVEESQDVLKNLLDKYWSGLLRPLHFFQRSAWEYSRALLEKDKPRDDALRIAQKNWIGNPYNPGEREDPYYQLCFRNINPIDSEFQCIAEEVFGPLLDHQKETYRERL